LPFRHALRLFPKDKQWFDPTSRPWSSAWTGTELVADTTTKNKEWRGASAPDGSSASCGASSYIRDRRQRHSLYARLPGLDAFAGTKVHSSDFKTRIMEGRKALVLGSGTVAMTLQELQAHGAGVTCQRSRTYV
jgi:hypothetical protein